MQLQDKLDADVERIRTESDFFANLERIVSNPPDIVILDVMVRWADPTPRMPKPPDDYRGPFRAGLNCLKALLDWNTRVPVVLYTVLDHQDLEEDLNDLPAHIVHLSKDAQVDPLIDEIRMLTDKA